MQYRGKVTKIQLRLFLPVLFKLQHNYGCSTQGKNLNHSVVLKLSTTDTKWKNCKYMKLYKKTMANRLDWKPWGGHSFSGTMSNFLSVNE